MMINVRRHMYVFVHLSFFNLTDWREKGQKIDLYSQIIAVRKYETVVGALISSILFR